MPVATGIGLGDRIEVTGELDADGHVIVRGAERLKAGQKVRFEKVVEIAKAP